MSCSTRAPATSTVTTGPGTTGRDATRRGHPADLLVALVLRGGEPRRVRGHARRRQPRPADDHPQQPRRWLRPDRPGRRAGDGGQRHHRRLVHGRQHRRRRRRRRDDRADGPGRRRAHDDDRRARRGRLDVLLRQRVPPAGRHAARPADERARGDPGAGRLAVPDDRRLRRGVEGRPGLDHRRRWLVARRPGPSVPDAARRRGRDRPQRRQLRHLRRRRPAHQRPARQQDPGRLLGPRRVRGPDRVGRAAGAGRLR